jgi:transcriptional regulator with XRE-family HTH domain
MPKRPPSFADQLRSEIESCGKTRYRISKETGVSQETLSRFMNGHRGVPMDVIGKLFDNLGLKISKR